MVAVGTDLKIVYRQYMNNSGLKKKSILAQLVTKLILWYFLFFSFLFFAFFLLTHHFSLNGFLKNYFQVLDAILSPQEKIALPPLVSILSSFRSKYNGQNSTSVTLLPSVCMFVLLTECLEKCISLLYLSTCVSRDLMVRSSRLGGDFAQFLAGSLLTADVPGISKLCLGSRGNKDEQDMTPCL